MKKIICMMLILALVCSTTVVFAEENVKPEIGKDYQVVEVEYFPDGSYTETVIFDDEFADSSLITGITPLAKKTVTKSKTYNYKTASGKVLWYAKVTGTFTYGDGSAKCTAYTPSAASKDKSWIISEAIGKKGSNWCSTSAIAKHKNSLGITDKTMSKTVKLTCSPTGVFS